MENSCGGCRDPSMLPPGAARHSLRDNEAIWSTWT
ncbi:MAG: hypothetical protein IT518_07965 [Burkholderiales bacterium]|nr:hypothetical protein [Burkholderiales bacterium]